jgi:hypothetical protein
MLPESHDFRVFQFQPQCYHFGYDTDCSSEACFSLAARLYVGAIPAETGSGHAAVLFGSEIAGPVFAVVGIE